MQIVFTPLFCWKEIENLGDLSRLRLVLDYLPDELLMRTLESHRGKGRDEYQIRAVWNSILAGVIFQHNSVESLRRELKRNDRLRRRYRFLPILSTLGTVVLVACLIALPAIGPKLSYDEIIPRVLITRANGEKVAEGAMPFGWDGTCGYSWRVPEDIKLDGNEETFNVQVRYDTLELYGKVTATRQIVIYQD